MSGSSSAGRVALAVRPVAAITRRNVSTAFRTPSLLLPPVVAPVVFLLAFSGALSELAELPEFDYSPGYVAFEFTFVVLQGAVFTGMFSGLTLARDFDTGVARRLLGSTGDGRLVVAGYVMTAVWRAPFVTIVLFVVGLLAGMRLEAGVGDLLLLFALTEFLAALGALWAAGIALRFRTLQAAPLMQFAAFLMVYLTPVFTPRHLLNGWLGPVAAINPFTSFLELGRGLMEGQLVRPTATAVQALVLTGVLCLWVVRGLRRSADIPT